MQEKFIESFEVDDYEIETDTGWESLSHIHKTILFDVWRVETEQGNILECADDHILMDEAYNQVFVKNCIANKTKIRTSTGIQVITKVLKLDIPAEHMYDATVDSNNHTLYTNGILSHNTTLNTIYALWLTCFNDSKRVVVVANKENTAIIILRRISMAYEELPNWLKPGTAQYGKKELIFGNRSSIAISTTTGSAVRGDTVNCILIDEMAHIEDHVVEDFWASVIPTISSSKKRTTKIFVVSTPKGTGNKFHDLYTKAQKGEIDGEDGNGMYWKAEQFYWYEVPGRGKTWKRDMIAALNGDEKMFNQEFEGVFLETGESAVDNELLTEMEARARAPSFTYEDGHYKIWDEPKEGHLYGIGVDIGDGIGRAASVVQVFDFTDLSNIQQVAVFHDNLIHPLNFAEMLNRIGRHWGKPPMLIERNNMGGEVINNLDLVHHYPNIVSYNPDEAKYGGVRLGVHSHQNSKYFGVMNMRYWINTLRTVNIYDIGTIQELKTFVRYPNGTWKKKQGEYIYDDRVMALVWCLFTLYDEIVDRYYEVVERDENGKPSRISAYTINEPGIFKLDPFFQRNEDAPIPAVIGMDMDPTSTSFNALRDQGWRRYG